MDKLGYSKIEILIVIILLGIVAFITINKTSTAFAIDKTGAVNEVKYLIEIQFCKIVPVYIFRKLYLRNSIKMYV